MSQTPADQPADSTSESQTPLGETPEEGLIPDEMLPDDLQPEKNPLARDVDDPDGPGPGSGSGPGDPEGAPGADGAMGQPG